MKNNLIIISPTWPKLSGGYGIASNSGLIQYLQVFDEVCFIGLTEEPPHDHCNAYYSELPVNFCAYPYPA